MFSFSFNWYYVPIRRLGVCNQLSKISEPTLAITGTEDVSVPAANSLIMVQNIPAA